MRRPSPKPVPSPIPLQAAPRAGVLLPRPLAGAYDYKLPVGVNAPRGTLVTAPLGNTQMLGVVWGPAAHVASARYEVFARQRRLQREDWMEF